MDSFFFERSVKSAAIAATVSCSAPLLRHWIHIRATDAGRPTLSGALALLFDRAAALFGTKAAAAERHRATMRRCILQIARRAATLPIRRGFLPILA
jgi:hypothetical protein